MRDYCFWLDGVCSLDYGIKMQEPITFPVASRKYQTRDIPGRNGVLHISQNSFSQVSSTARLFVLENNASDAMSRAVQWLIGKTGVRKLEIPHEQDTYRTVIIYDGGNSSNRQNLLHAFDVTISSSPQRWLKCGEKMIDSPSILRNDYMPTSPLLRVEGSGSGNINVSGTTISIIEQTEPIIIDCMAKKAYTDNNIPKNAKIHTPNGFPVLGTGENTISHSGGVTKVQIIPRWWML